MLHTEEVKSELESHLVHDIFFWLGRANAQNEAGTAAYRTVELDELPHGAAIQHRGIQISPSDAISALFPRLRILRGCVRSGFSHVNVDGKPQHTDVLIRLFKHPSPTAGRDAVVVHEVESTWQSLDESDVFTLTRTIRSSCGSVASVRPWRS